MQREPARKAATDPRRRRGCPPLARRLLTPAAPRPPAATASPPASSSAAAPRMYLSASDLRESQRRLESRGREVAERARQKAEKERLLAERQAARAAAREEEARRRRLEQAAAEEEERRQYAAELEANNGVLYRAELTAVPAPESIAADKGIRRAADKARRTGAGLPGAAASPHARPRPRPARACSDAPTGKRSSSLRPSPPADPAAALGGRGADEAGRLQKRAHVLQADRAWRALHARRPSRVLRGRGLCGAAAQGALAPAPLSRRPARRCQCCALARLPSYAC